MAKKRSLRRKPPPRIASQDPTHRWWTNLQISERQALEIQTDATRFNLTPPEFIVHACKLIANLPFLPDHPSRTHDLDMANPPAKRFPDVQDNEPI